MPPLPELMRGCNLIPLSEILAASSSDVGTEPPQTTSITTERVQTDGEGETGPTAAACDECLDSYGIEPASAGSDNDENEEAMSLVNDFWMHPFKLEVDLQDDDWLMNLKLKYLLNYSMKTGFSFNGTKNMLCLLHNMGLLKDVNLKAIQTAVDSNATEALNSLKLRTCPECGKDSVAPYIFCQNCLPNKRIRLIKSCQVPGCPANNRTAYELMKQDGFLERSNVKEPKSLKKQGESTEEKRNKVLSEGFETHSHDTCTHSRTTSTAEECVFESLVGVFGDMIKNGQIGLLRHTTPEDSLEHIKKAIAGKWVSSASSYNRLQCYNRLNMREHAMCIAQYLDSLQSGSNGDSYLKSGIDAFMHRNSPEKKMGLKGNTHM